MLFAARPLLAGARLGGAPAGESPASGWSPEGVALGALLTSRRPVLPACSKQATGHELRMRHRRRKGWRAEAGRQVLCAAAAANRHACPVGTLCWPHLRSQVSCRRGPQVAACYGRLPPRQWGCSRACAAGTRDRLACSAGVRSETTQTASQPRARDNCPPSLCSARSRGAAAQCEGCKVVAIVCQTVMGCRERGISCFLGLPPHAGHAAPLLEALV